MAYSGRHSDTFPSPHHQAAPLLYAASTLPQTLQPPPPAPSLPLPSSSYAYYSNPIAPNPNPNPNPLIGISYSAPDPAPLFQLGLYNAGQPAPYAYPTASSSVGNVMVGTPRGLGTKMQKVIEGGAAADSVKVCSICNVVCNSDKVFAAHLAGTKHATKMAHTRQHLRMVILEEVIETDSEHMSAFGTSGLNLSAQGLVKPWVNKVKRQAVVPAAMKPSKTVPKVVKSVYCEVCKIECNSQEILNNHKMGRKHKSNLRKLQESFAPMPKPSNRTAEVVQAAYCDICKITCNSQEILNTHEMGKKHKNNLQKLQESLAPKPMGSQTMGTASGVASVAEVDKASSDKEEKGKGPETKADLETKKRKMIEGGTAADAVRVCILCNVACNSETVFNFHISGQKHLNMLKKREGRCS